MFIQAGVFANIPIDECFSFHPEILFGSDMVFQVPVVFRYGFNYRKGKTIPYLDLGLIPAKKKISGDETAIVKDHEILTNSETNPFRYGCLAGAGLEHKFSLKHSLYFGIRYKYLEGNLWNEYKEKVHHVALHIAYGFSML